MMAAIWGLNIWQVKTAFVQDISSGNKNNIHNTIFRSVKKLEAKGCYVFIANDHWAKEINE